MDLMYDFVLVVILPLLTGLGGCMLLIYYFVKSDSVG
jgi:hypothetical protein